MLKGTKDVSERFEIVRVRRQAYGSMQLMKAPSFLDHLLDVNNGHHPGVCVLLRFVVLDRDGSRVAKTSIDSVFVHPEMNEEFVGPSDLNWYESN